MPVIMRFMFFFVLLTATLAIDPGTSCGISFVDLVYNCAHPTLSKTDSCCPAIRRYNDAHCWCQPSGLAVATNLATNSYALALRTFVCNVTNPLLPSFPSRDGPPTLNTCPLGYASLPADDMTERCENPAELRKRRNAALATFDRLTLASLAEGEVKRFKNVVGRLFGEDSRLVSVGLWGMVGREHVVDFLLSRQSVLGSPVAWVPENGRSERMSRFWRAGTVSYGIDFVTPNGFLANRRVFAGFEECSDAFLDVYIVEQGVIDSLSAQFYYPAEPKDAVSMYGVSAEEICDRIEEGCGEFSPYESGEDCVTFMKELKSEGKVMCNQFNQEKTPVTAIMGDTSSCRYQYALAAKVDPERYCPWIGKVGSGLCAQSFCKEELYEDIFSSDVNPRYYESSSFQCNIISGECSEFWPIENPVGSSDGN